MAAGAAWAARRPFDRDSSVGRFGRLLAVVAFLALLLGLAEVAGLRQHVSLEYLQQQLAANRLSGLALFVLLFMVGNLIQIPGWLFLAAAVLALGRTWGGLVTYLAASSSCAATFFAIRLIGGDALARLENKTALRLLGQLKSHPVRSIVILRTLFQTLPALNYSLALSGIGFAPYMLGTLLGLPLPIAAYCIFFDFLGALFGHH